MRLRLIAWTLIAGLLAGCSGQADHSAKSTRPRRIDDPRLHNAFRLHDRVISGGLPDEASFQALKELGVQTVISVDGARPDVDLAKKYGMRYVHLPHGYDGIPETRARELARAVRDLPGPVFIHCHHGKHRSPAAAATACISAGLIEPGDGLALLKGAGTSENYRGLYQSVQDAVPFDTLLLDQLEVVFQETVPVPPMAEAMVAIETLHDQLKAFGEHDWKTLPSNPDLVPSHAALLLRENFTELLRTEEVGAYPERFQALLRDSERAGLELESALQGLAAGEATAAAGSVTEAFARITRNCKSCHHAYRDTPLREKQGAK